MKWGGKKPASSSSSSTSSISHVFPISWLSVFKQKGEKSDVVPPKMNDTFYGKEDDAFWRLSLGGESVDRKRSKCDLKSVRYESDYEMEIPRPSCQSCRSKVDSKDSQLFNNMVSDIRKTKQLHEHVEILPENDTKSKNVFPERKLTKKNRRIAEEKLELKNLDRAEETIPSKLAKDDTLEWKPELRIRTIMRDDYLNFKGSGSRRYPYCESPETRDADLGSSEEDHTSEDFAKWENREKIKFEDLEGRRSLYTSRELQRRKTRRSRKASVQSPRTPLRVEICKIKVIEDRKKAKMKTKNKIKEKPTTEVGSAFERFAVVKFSYDLQQDFRESMVEMIKEKEVTRPEELEELLVCYLTLNSDEYHELIIKVFRQVWFDMNQPYFDPDLQSQYFYYN